MLIETGRTDLIIVGAYRHDHDTHRPDIWIEDGCNHPIAEVDGRIIGCHRQGIHWGHGPHAVFTDRDVPRFPPGTQINMICDEAAAAWFKFA